MKYAYRCPVCGHDLDVETDSEQKAVERLADEAVKHMRRHPDSPAPSAESLRDDIRKNLRRQ